MIFVQENGPPAWERRRTLREGTRVMVEILRTLGHIVWVFGNIAGVLCWILAVLDFANHDPASSDYSGAMLLFFLGSVCFVLGRVVRSVILTAVLVFDGGSADGPKSWSKAVFPQ